jgi:hypothetical protein
LQVRKLARQVDQPTVDGASTGVIWCVEAAVGLADGTATEVANSPYHRSTEGR